MSGKKKTADNTQGTGKKKTTDNTQGNGEKKTADKVQNTGEKKTADNAQDTEEKSKNVKAEVLGWVEAIALAVILALFIDNFIIINATIPSGSMEKTSMTGDRVLGLRFSYWF